MRVAGGVRQLLGTVETGCLSMYLVQQTRDVGSSATFEAKVLPSPLLMYFLRACIPIQSLHLWSGLCRCVQPKSDGAFNQDVGGGETAQVAGSQSEHPPPCVSNVTSLCVFYCSQLPLSAAFFL